MKIDSDKYPLPPRLRHHTGSNLYIPLAELSEKPDFYPPLISEIDWQSIFFNGLAPNILDVGCGKAKLLFDYAENHPSENILGIEVRKYLPDWINEVVRGENIQNAGAIWYSVVNGLNFIQSDSINKIFYLFPDPWPKQKHRKRRAFNTSVINEFIRVMTNGAKLFLATDIHEVHLYHLKLVSKFPELEIKIIDNDDEWELPITNKESFCRKMNIAFYRLIVTKKS